METFNFHIMLISIDQKSEENFVVNMMMSAATEKLSGIL